MEAEGEGAFVEALTTERQASGACEQEQSTARRCINLCAPQAAGQEAQPGLLLRNLN